MSAGNTSDLRELQGVHQDQQLQGLSTSVCAVWRSHQDLRCGACGDVVTYGECDVVYRDDEASRRA